MTLIRIRGGKVYDPANGIDGQVQDLWIADGRIVAALHDSTIAGKPLAALDVDATIARPLVRRVARLRLALTVDDDARGSEGQAERARRRAHPLDRGQPR